MHMRIVWGRLRPGKWDEYEAAYRRVFLTDSRPIPGLKSRWVARDAADADAGYSISLWENAEAMRAYEAGDFLRKVAMPALQPFFVGDFKTTHCDLRVSEEF